MDGKPEDPDINIELRAGGELITITASNGAIDIRLGAAQGTAAAVVTGKPETILQLFAGRIDLPAALAAGVRWEGAPDILRRVVTTASVNHAESGGPVR